MKVWVLPRRRARQRASPAPRPSLLVQTPRTIDLQMPIAALLRSSAALQLRVRELEAINDGARHSVVPPALSEREREVLKLLTEGARSPCIATRLLISPATVEVHRRNIMRKLGLHTVAALTKYAVREGLTSL